MDTRDHIGNLVDNAIEKAGAQLDGILALRHNKQIRWNNLRVEHESDFVRGFLLSEVIHEVANRFHKMKSRQEFLEVYKATLERAIYIKKAIAEIRT
jgi:hypothetical protein